MAADSVVSTPSDRPGRSLPRLVDRFELSVIDDPGALVMDRGTDTLTRAELWIAAGLAAAEIRSAVGFERQTVAVHPPDDGTWLVMLLAVLRAGHIPVILPAAATVEDVRHVFETAKPAMVVATLWDAEASPAPTVLRAEARAAGVTFAVADGTSLEVYGSDRGDFEPADPGAGG